MPGYADYNRLYLEEYKTLKWEGYDVDSHINNDECSPDFMPDPKNAQGYPQGDDFWEKQLLTFQKNIVKEIRKNPKYAECFE